MGAMDVILGIVALLVGLGAGAVAYWFRVKLTLGDVANLDWIGLQVPSGPSAIKVNLCWGAIFLLP